MIMKLAMCREIEDWDAMFAAFDFLNREGRIRGADCERVVCWSDAG
jgi:hypothetical protein